ncbi:hypothetical protein EXN66_Car018880 [Channa argus]|uniref:Uncharacterized protein n=1 Tax=Channa argus TaxID=215402 RepID=A0A6G1QKW4_CHAAH|nr:hypothetical protein EXN66_Car018880 [Channa argus]
MCSFQLNNHRKGNELKKMNTDLIAFSGKEEVSRGTGGSVVEHWVGMQRAAGLNPTPPGVAPPSNQGPPWCQSRARITWGGCGRKNSSSFGDP